MSLLIPVAVRVIDPIHVPVFLAGTPVELSKNSTHLLWRYVGEPAWRNLIALSELGGPGGGGGPANTDALPEGVSNLYFTAQRALDATAGVTTGLADLITANQQAQDGVNTGLQGQINLKAPLASPVFTGNPEAPTPGPATNSDVLATTAFVHLVVAASVPSNVVTGPDTTTEDQVPLWDSTTRKLKDGLATSQGGNGSFDGLKIVRFTSLGQLKAYAEGVAAIHGTSDIEFGVHGTSGTGSALYGNVTGAGANCLRMTHAGASGYFIRAWKGGANDAFRMDRDGALSWPDGGPGPQSTVDALPAFGAANKGVVPVSGGGTANFLRADGAWAAPVAAIPQATEAVLGGMTIAQQSEADDHLTTNDTEAITPRKMWGALTSVFPSVVALNADALQSGTVPNARLDALLQAIAALTTSANKLLRFTGTDTVDQVDMQQGDGAPYTGTVDWTGTDPTGTPTNTQYFTRIGNVVFWRLVFSYPGAGSGITGLTATLPAEFPPPAIPGGFEGANAYIAPCHAGRFFTSASGGLAINTNCNLRRNGTNDGFEIVASIATGAYNRASLGGMYHTS